MHSVRFLAALLLIGSTSAFATPVHAPRGPLPLSLRAPAFLLQGTKAPVPKGLNDSRLPKALPATYAIIDVADAGTGSGQGTFAIYVDAFGKASGYYVDGDNNYHSYFRTAGGTITTFDVNGADSQTIAHWANEKGAIVGDYLDSNTDEYEGFLRGVDGSVETYDGAGSGAHYTVPVSINSHGLIAGYYYGNGYGTDVHAFVRDKHGVVSPFDAPDAGTDSFQGTYSQDVNMKGQIVGFYLDSDNVDHGFIRAPDGSISKFDAPGAGTGAFQGTQGIGINNKGWITGDYVDSDGLFHGFVRDPIGNYTSFDAPDAGPGGTEPIELNNQRQITGWYLDASNVYHGFLRSKKGAIEEFDAPGSGTGAYLGTSGYDINKYGVVAGWDQDDAGVYHAFLRTP